MGPCACRCSRASSPHRARRCRSQAPCTTPTHCSGTTGLSASRPARTTRPAAASPSGPSAGSTASGRQSPGSRWASPATTRSRRVSWPPTPWSTASPVIHGAKHGLRQIYGSEPWHHEPRPEVIDHGCTLGVEPVLLKLWPALWTFADVPDVEPTNNAAERGLRAAVIYRKLSFGRRSQGGERTIERPLSVDQTCRLQRRSLYAYLTGVVTAKARGHPIPT